MDIYIKIITFFSFLFVQVSLFAAAPEIECGGLPGCSSGGGASYEASGFFINLISDFTQIVAVFAVFALMLSGILYVISGGEEEKATKAKKWIIWSLVGVFLSASAWSIIKLINNFNFNF